MERYSSRWIAIAVVLAALAGFVDAIVFTILGFFASFMSGNSTRLAVGLGSGAIGDAAIAAALVLAFVAGVIAGTVVARVAGARARGAVMGFVAVLLALSAALSEVAPARIDLLLAAAAMGAMNGVLAEGGEVTVGVTYMTGSLVKLGQRLAAALMGAGNRWAWLPYLALWSGFVAGAALGAGAALALGMTALWVAAGAAAVVGALVSR
ncbi:MAG: DUF1275 family protein [Sphingomonas sp.]|uniref:DUF1275 family protein n=1 Tax=Sphingomonas sp. TaxID=28214 RepID=UPI001AD1553C|nr:DUF1275 family protein [Sphingomonas sp.]MBN8808640.1 DUF1275 family protein [Sphingomonas sp.]